MGSNKQFLGIYNDLVKLPNPFGHNRELATATAEYLHQLGYRKDDEIRAAVEKLFADGTTPVTFIRKRDGKKGVEDCHLIIKSEWQGLEKGE